MDAQRVLSTRINLNEQLKLLLADRMDFSFLNVTRDAAVKTNNSNKLAKNDKSLPAARKREAMFARIGECSDSNLYCL